MPSDSPTPDSQSDASCNTTQFDGSGNRSNRSNSDASCNTTHVDDDCSGNSFVFYSLSDLSNAMPYVEPITDLSYSNTTAGVGYKIVDESGKSADGSEIDRTTFETTQPELYDPQIHQNLEQVIDVYNDLSGSNTQSAVLLDQIKAYAAEIQCSDFHGKGSIDDYTALFTAASKIATESKQMELDVDIEGFNQFAEAADELSALFNGFIIKLQNVNIITDLNFLRSISAALGRIVNLSNTFGRFKQAIFATSAIQLPKSAHETKNVIVGVMDEINCAMQYMNYFVSPEENPNLVNAQLSAAETNIIAKSVQTIENWNTLCEYGVSIAMSDNTDIKLIHQASEQLKQTTISLKGISSKFKTKFATFNIVC